MYVDCVGKNLKYPCIYYFDSTGDPATPEVEALVERIKNQGGNNIKFTYLENDKVHQSGDSECG